MRKPKTKPRHQARLTVKRIERLRPGKYGDGGGLALLVSPIGSKSWVFRFERNGRDRAMVLGPLHGNGGDTPVPREERRGLTLSEARSKAADLNKLLKSGIDPIDAKKAKGQEAAEAAAEKAKRKTFEQLAADYDAAKSSDWTNAHYRAKFLSSLKMYAFPIIGSLPVEMIDTVLVKNILEPIWLTKNPTADRLRARIEAVLDYATALKLRSGENPARWSIQSKLLPKKAQTVKHHSSLSFEAMPAFVTELELGTCAALEFLILTAARSGEVLGAKWSEIELRVVPVTSTDQDNETWTCTGPAWIVPAERMKEKRQHRVPLSDRAVELLKKVGREGEYVFPGARKGRPLGKNTFFKLLNAIGRDDLTTHGFRSSFRTWAAKKTEFPDDVAELALSHVVGSSTQRAYQRDDLFDRRRPLMAEWARFVSGSPTDAKVIPIRKRGS